MTNFVMIIYIKNMEDNLGKALKAFRKEKKLTIVEVSGLTGIDQALLSKYENSKRTPSENHLKKIASGLEVDIEELNKYLLVEKIVNLVRYEANFQSVMMVAEARVEYLRSQDVFDVPKLTLDQQHELWLIDNLKEKWQSEKPLKGIQLQKMQEYFNIKYTYDSNRIEGNTLSLQETQLVINKGFTISGKSMKEHLEAINHAEAIDFMIDMVSGREEINKRNLLDIHRLVLKSIDTENAGKYRTVPVMISGSEHVPPQPYLIEKMMEDYFNHYEKQKKIMHPVILAAEMHERLVSIHPFIDGNGRTSRLLMNFILLKNGYTVAILKGDQESRIAYYKALEKVQTDNDPSAFYDIIIKCTLDSLKEHLKMV